MIEDFVHLHCHSEYSPLDGMPKVEEYLIKSNQLGFKGLALTEHGNMRSMFQLHQKSLGKFNFRGTDYKFDPIKPIFGVEFYLAPLGYKTRGMPEDQKEIIKKLHKGKIKQEINKKVIEAEMEQGFRQRYHILIFAKNIIGLKNLYKLHYLSWKEGFYYRPRIDLELLKIYHEGLIVTTSCIGGEVPQLLKKEKHTEAEIWLQDMKKIFKDDLYLEIQPHNIEDQIEINKKVIDLSYEHKIKVIATNDCHYVEKDDIETHRILLAIQTGGIDKEEGDRFRFQGDDSFYMKSKQEMTQEFRKYHSMNIFVIRLALEHTMEIYEKCNVILPVDRKKGLLPSIDIPFKSMSEKEYFVYLCKKGWEWRKIAEKAKEYAKIHDITVGQSKQVYVERVKMELKRIIKLKFINYFLMIYEIIRWARENDIMVGPGRGSSAGSLVAYLLGITSIDPIRYNLLFDRFLGADRVDFPDVDMDFQDNKRELIFQHIYDKYGEKNVSQIGTFGKMKGKQALLDVSRALKKASPQEVFAVNKELVPAFAGDARADMTIIDAFKRSEVCKEFNDKYPEVKPHAAKLEGRIKYVGIHPAGIQVAPFPIDEIVPIEYRTNKGKNQKLKVSSLNWEECQGFGLVKIDVLGLRTLTVLKHALKAIEEVNMGVSFDLEEINLEDKEVLDKFTNVEFEGIFQFDSIGMKTECKDMIFTQFEDIVAMNALYRPGATQSGALKKFIKRKAGKENIQKIHSIYDEITKHTQGIIVYQEQFIRLFVDLGGYSAIEADKVRKKMAKSKGVEAIREEKVKFSASAIKQGMKEKEVDKLFRSIENFGKYGFNKAHAAAYSMIAYWCMYIKYHYPLEFWYSLLRHEDDLAEISRFVRIARESNGIQIITPDINKSQKEFTIVGDTIQTGLIDIKGVGDKACENIIESRNFEFHSLWDFCNKVKRRIVHKGVIQALIKSGAFNSIYGKGSIGDLLFIDGKNAVWQLMLKDDRKAAFLYENYNGEHVFNDHEEMKVMDQVCPIPTSMHKIDYYDWIRKSFRKNIEFTKLGEMEDIKLKSVTVVGLVIDIKYFRVGDYDDPSRYTDEQRELKRWGDPMIKFNIDDGTGTFRVYVDEYSYPTYRHIFDKGERTPVVIRGIIYDGKIYACIVLDLDELGKKWYGFKDWKDKYYNSIGMEKYFLYHPMRQLRKEFSSDKYIKIKEVCERTEPGTYFIVGLILRIKRHLTKTDRLMGFFNVEDESGRIIPIIAWPEMIEKHKDILKEGNIIAAKISCNKTDQFFEKVRLIKKVYTYSN